jgi:hypothetical protein
VKLGRYSWFDLALWALTLALAAPLVWRCAAAIVSALTDVAEVTCREF